MDELEISGKRYISAARAAKEHKYHSDYIGQLIRGKKVVGQKVGRAWYVDADSLSEYLGKEVPPRGPMVREVKEEPVPEPIKEVVATGSDDRPLTSIFGSATGLSSEPSQAPTIVPTPTYNEESKSEFLMPLRKSGRSHVIEALGETPVVPKKEIEIEQTTVASTPTPVYETRTEVVEAPAPDTTPGEETFIPLKITKQPVQLYNEPEDSFYKVSRKGLRYVKNAEPVARVVSEERVYAQTKKGKSKGNASAVAKALSMVLVAGILSLGVGVLMSYYLHSITTVEEAGQTSSVILSN